MQVLKSTDKVIPQCPSFWEPKASCIGAKQGLGSAQDSWETFAV